MTPEKAPSEPVSAAEGVPGTSGHPDPAAWDRRGGSLWLDREQWGIITDALIEHQSSATARKGANSASNSGVRAEICVRLIQTINTAARSCADEDHPDPAQAQQERRARYAEALCHPSTTPVEDVMAVADAEAQERRDECARINRALAGEVLRLHAEVAELREHAGEQRILGAVMARDDQAIERDALREDVDEARATLARVKELCDRFGELVTVRHIRAALDAPTEPGRPEGCSPLTTARLRGTAAGCSDWECETCHGPQPEEPPP